MELKLLCRSAVLSSASLPNTVAKEAYHLPFEPSSSRLFGEGLSVLLERSDKMKEDKRQKTLHEAVIHSVKPRKGPGQHRVKHNALQGGGPKKDHGQYRKKKNHAKKGGHAFKQAHPACKGGGKSDVNP